MTHLQNVVVEVDPARSPLVRQTTDYSLTLSGDVASPDDRGASPASADGAQISGVYMSKISSAGAVRFSPDGSVTASNGDRGTWTLFDGGARIYTVFLSGTRYTATLSPGRGLVDTGNPEPFI